MRVLRLDALSIMLLHTRPNDNAHDVIHKCGLMDEICRLRLL
ncbi:hypothetical protein THTE_1877 [Thermogutta terrifontis]|uniref:Uncharacterized protein n=1 Tax=Thermogutta terrifontis TaxID=1331910 RepID=A0A286RET2_9BACT|nr:hypothetical protein THTE_1877 [Thermogutta terrifontis]